MFGDLGHGLLMFLFAAFLVLREKPLAAKKTDNEVCTNKNWKSLKEIINFIFVLGVEYILLWPLHHIAYGSLLDVHRFYIQ